MYTCIPKRDTNTRMTLTSRNWHRAAGHNAFQDDGVAHGGTATWRTPTPWSPRLTKPVDGKGGVGPVPAGGERGSIPVHFWRRRSRAAVPRTETGLSEMRVQDGRWCCIGPCKAWLGSAAALRITSPPGLKEHQRPTGAADVTPPSRR